jgi:dienelactone hydrolase
LPTPGHASPRGSVTGNSSSLRIRLSVLLAAAIACASFQWFGRQHPHPPPRDGQPPHPFAVLGRPRPIAPGVTEREAVLPSPAGWFQVWVYLPDRPTRARLPCILIAPSGSRLFHGQVLHEFDRPQHIPFARAGFAVVAYEIDGAVSDEDSDDEMVPPARAFQAADGGLMNERAALDFALANVPEIDPGRIYAAGHSSAGTMALYVAEHDPRIAACAAFASPPSVASHIGPGGVDYLESRIPGSRQFLSRISPDTGIASLRCPVFLFHSEADTTVRPSKIAQFAEALRRVNPRVKYVMVHRGGHTAATLETGIPMAIEWLKGLDGRYDRGGASRAARTHTKKQIPVERKMKTRTTEASPLKTAS